VKLRLYSAIIILAISSSAIAADKLGVISRDANLYDKPFRDSTVIAELPTATAITILKRQGGWYQIKATEKQGWVRLTRVRLNRKNNNQPESDNETESGVGALLTGLTTGRGKSSQDTTATAVKGLGEEELRNAEPDEDALNSLDSFAVDSSESGDSGLQTRSVDYLPTENKKVTAPSAKPINEEEEEE